MPGIASSLYTLLFVSKVLLYPLLLTALGAVVLSCVVRTVTTCTLNVMCVRVCVCVCARMGVGVVQSRTDMNPITAASALVLAAAKVVSGGRPGRLIAARAVGLS